MLTHDISQPQHSSHFLRQFEKSLHYSIDECVYPVVVTQGTAKAEGRTLRGVVQAGAGGAAQPG